MNIFDHIIIGFSVSLTLPNIFYCLFGVFVGTLVGILPGLGPTAAIALFIPSTYYLDPISAIIMLSGIYYGAMYGGSTTSILVNLPGEVASVVTCLDGYQMALQGRAGAALGISAFGSFIAGTIGVVGLMIATPLLSKIALKFGPPEYVSLIFLSFSILTYLAAGSILKAVMMAAVGVFLGCVGMDFITGQPRFNYGSLTLADGIGIVPLVVGIFGVAEVLDNLERKSEDTKVLYAKLKNLLPSLQDWKDSIGAIIRGSFIGFFLGLLPGGGAIIASFTAYAVEKKISKNPERFGKGAIQGVAGPESANNSAVSSAFVPLMSLGIPPNVVMALILGALMIHGIRVGPMLIHEYPNLFWGVVTSMYIGNSILLVLNLPLIPLWVRIVTIPYRLLFPLILLFCLIGVYTLNNNIWEIIIMVIFGIVGYLMRKFKFEAAPLIFAFFLSPILENSLRQSLLMSQGNFSIFITQPISCSFIITGIILFCIPALPWFKRRKQSS